MPHATRHLVVCALALAACTQEPGTAEPPVLEAPAIGASTGALACDEFLALSRACASKNRFTRGQTGDIDALDLALRALVAGDVVHLDLDDVRASAVRWAYGKTRDFASAPEQADLPSPAVVCKRGIDQLPADCQ
jgi:hypothetical protein